MNKKLEKMLKRYLAADKAVDVAIGTINLWEAILANRISQRKNLEAETVDYIQKSNVGNRFLVVEAKLKTLAIMKYINES